MNLPSNFPILRQLTDWLEQKLYRFNKLKCADIAEKTIDLERALQLQTTQFKFCAYMRTLRNSFVIGIPFKHKTLGMLMK